MSVDVRARAGLPARARGLRARLAASPGATDSALALIASRLLVWAVGVPAFLALPISGDRALFDYGAVSQRMGHVGNVIGAPAVRWDSNWYVGLARDGYDNTIQPAFFPLYPLLMRAGGWIVGSEIVAGVLLSLVAFAVALVILHRLTTLELGAEAGRRSVLLLAFFPTAVFFSAVYTEALFLALELGAVYAARRGRWAWAGVLGALASATRNVGVLLVIPVALLYLYGPRADRDAEPRAARGWRPRFTLHRDAWWIALVPAGLVAYLVYTGFAYDDPLATWHAQAHFHRNFVGPLSSLGHGGGDALEGARALLTGDGSRGAGARHIALFGVALGAVAATVDILRRLPVAYGAYAGAALFWALATAEPDHPLFSTPRFIAVIFPLFMWLGWRLADVRVYAATLVAFAIGLAYCSAMFATWHFVA